MRIILSSFIALHGIIHLVGFVREWNLRPIGAHSGKTLIHLSNATAKFAGLLWLFACLLILAATVGYYSRKDWFWGIGIVAIALSQILILVYWSDAKWGTVSNVILSIVVVLAAGRVSYNTMVRSEINYLQSSAAAGLAVVTEEEVSVLPGIIQRWLRNSHIIGRAIPQRLHIVQKGSMRTDSSGNWMPFDAEQYFTIDPPGFVWNAHIHTGKFIDIIDSLHG
jgi:hypothetical protein